MNSYSTPSALTTAEARTAAILAHASGPLATFFSVGWLSVVGPLAVWLICKDRSAIVRKDAAEAFNFQVTMWLAAIVGGLLCITVILIPIGVVLLAGALIGSIVFGIIGALKVANGASYTYPWRINILS